MKHIKYRHGGILMKIIFAVIILLIYAPVIYSGPFDDIEKDTTEPSAISENDTGFSIYVPGIRSLDLDRHSIDFNPSIAQMMAGWTDQEELIAEVSANVGWVLTIRGTDDLWQGPWSKPVSDIYWKHDQGEFLPLDVVPADVASGGPVKEEFYPINIKIKMNLENDLPGDYYYAYVVFELSAP